MKIVAYLDPGYMVSITKEEMALILGYRGQHDESFKRHSFYNGQDLGLSDINKTAEFVRNINTSKLQSLKNSFQSGIDQIEKAEDLVNQINLFEKLKEGYDEKS